MSFSYVVFEPAKVHWIRHFLNRSIGHCYIVEPHNGKWLVINKSYCSLDIFVIDDLGDRIKGKRVIKVERRLSHGYGAMLNTCVGLVKARIGIKAAWVQTPKQLYKYLRSHRDGR
jgi:hypothetical protein